MLIDVISIFFPKSTINTHNFRKNLHDYITKALSQPIKPISPHKQMIIFPLNLQNYG